VLSGARLVWAEARHGSLRVAAREAMYDTLGRIPGADPAYERWRHPKRPVTDRRVADVVVEGYMGSANTWTAQVLISANPGLRVARHRHRPAQVLEGVRQRLPTLCLVREPVAAIASAIVRAHGGTPEAELARYAHFYAGCHKMCASGRVVVATFEQATGDIDAVIARLNTRFDTDFAGLAALGPSGAADVRADIAAADRVGYGESAALIGAMPSEERAASLAALRDELHEARLAPSLRRCTDLYEAFCQMSR
jgi:hypothetical protein